MKTLSETKAKVELGVSGRNTYSGLIRSDEFLQDLKGKKAIRRYMEIRDNNPIIGAVMYAIEQTLRDVKIKTVPANDSDEAKKEAEFLESILDDMEHTMDDHIAEAVSFLSYGFSWFEVVYKRRINSNTNNPKKYSKYNDGRVGVRKIAIRAPWTVERFEVDKESGDVLGMWQISSWGKPHVMIPSEKSIYYRTTSLNNDPSGRSVLRNCYTSYTYLNQIQALEAIAIERELHGVPIGRMPAEYLSSAAGDNQVALRNQFERILRDLKNNEQGYALLPSDIYTDPEGKPTNQRMMDIELITANGSRSIDINPVVTRYQHDIARSLMAEFLMLGSTSGGSYALSKSKTDLFLRSLESYINTIVDALNKQLVERLWQLNGLPWETMPKLVAGDVASHDLKELAAYLRNLNGADISVADQPNTVAALMEIAELPFNQEQYTTDLQDRKAKEEQQAKVNQQVALDQAKQPSNQEVIPKK